MKKLYILFHFCLSIILSNLTWAENISTFSCARHPIFIQQLDSKEANALWDTIVKTTELQKGEFFNNETLLRLFKADINNDTIPEYIAITADYSGNMGLESVNIFRKEGDKFISLGEPPEPESRRNQDGGWYSYTSDLFLTQICGKTYMTFRLISDEAAYIWEKSGTQVACDDEWIVYQRDKAKKQYQAGDYNGAYHQLILYINPCGLSKHSLWMLNDAAFYALKLGKVSACLSLLDSIKNHYQYAHATKALKEAVKANYLLCKAQEINPVVLDAPHGQKIYHWLLDKASYPTRYPSNKIQELLLNTISGTWQPSNDSEIYATISDFQVFFNGPIIVNNRYVWLEGRWPHGNTEAAFVWVDVEKGTSLVGKTDYSDDYLFDITSKNFNANTVPFQAKQSIANLANELNYYKDNANTKIIFFDPIANKEVILPFSWLMSH